LHRAIVVDEFLGLNRRLLPWPNKVVPAAGREVTCSDAPLNIHVSNQHSVFLNLDHRRMPPVNGFVQLAGDP
jgi:hypothetical protein